MPIVFKGAKVAAYFQTAGVVKFEAMGFLSAVFRDALDAKCSDIHIEPMGNDVLVRLRHGDSLRELIRVPVGLSERIMQSLRVWAALEAQAPGVPVDGRIIRQELPGYEFRLSLFPVVKGEKAAIRIFSVGTRRFSLDSLQWNPEQIQLLRGVISGARGMVLFAGPTGSGKTTAAYCAVADLYSQSKGQLSVSSVEDPVEYALMGMSQAQVDVVKGFTYPVALKSVLRQDPQVLLIGEIRDPDTAVLAASASMAGHLVISTFHAGSSVGVVFRLRQMGLDAFNLGAGLSAVINVRLVKELCPHCRQQVAPTSVQQRMLPPAWSGDCFESVGCDQCFGSGLKFQSRLPLVEIFSPDDVVRDAVISGVGVGELRKLIGACTTFALWSSTLDLVSQGRIGLQEAIWAAYSSNVL